MTLNFFFYFHMIEITFKSSKNKSEMQNLKKDYFFWGLQ